MQSQGLLQFRPIQHLKFQSPGAGIRVDWQGSQIEHVIHVSGIERFADIPFLESESRFIAQMLQIAPIARREIINAQNRVTPPSSQSVR